MKKHLPIYKNTVKKGDIVLIDFPFSNLVSSKVRPAIAISECIGQDIILAQITSKKQISNTTVKIDSKELLQPCFIKVHKLFTIEINNIIKHIGEANKETQEKINKVIKNLLIEN